MLRGGLSPTTLNNRGDYNPQSPCCATHECECFQLKSVIVCNSCYVVTSIRLVSSNGDTSEVLSGRLEILINDTWGTVCDDGFSVSQAAMACNQLGFISFNTYSNAEKLNW